MFERFRIEYSLPSKWPVPIEHISVFISYCFEQGYLPATIITYVSGIVFYHKLYNWLDPTNIFVVRKLLEGCKQMRRRTDSRAPITYNILKNICIKLSHICFSKYEVIFDPGSLSAGKPTLLCIPKLVIHIYVQ